MRKAVIKSEQKDQTQIHRDADDSNQVPTIKRTSQTFETATNRGK